MGDFASACDRWRQLITEVHSAPCCVRNGHDCQVIVQHTENGERDVHGQDRIQEHRPTRDPKASQGGNVV